MKLAMIGLGRMGANMARHLKLDCGREVTAVYDLDREAAGALATELGLRPLVAHCHFGLGKLYRQTSKQTQAREHLTTATTMYREMSMQFWLEKDGKETW